MDENIKERLEKFLEGKIRDLKLLTRRAAETTAQGSALNPAEFSRLKDANDSAAAALSIQAAMQETDDLKRLILKIQDRLNDALEQAECGIAYVKVFNWTLRYLRDE